MKLPVLLILSILLLGACEEPIPHVLIDNNDTIPKSGASVSIKRDNYGGKIPGLDAKVIDYTLPNPYQHKKQLFRDSTVATSWDDAGFPNAKDFIRFFKTFQWVVMDKDGEKIASMIEFPLRQYKTKEAFLKDFDKMFGPDFINEILDQDPLEIYRDGKGAMIGDDGQIWFKMIRGQYRIIEINP